MNLIEDKLKSMGFVLPSPPKAIAAYVPSMILQGQIFTSGQLPLKEGNILKQGRLGKEFTIETVKESTIQSVLNGLSIIKSQLGSLDKIKQFIRLGVFVASTENFFEQHLVANHASNLLLDAFGESGRHVRSAIGVNALPLNAPVEIEFTVSF